MKVYILVNTIKVKENKSNIINNSYIIENMKSSKVNLQGLLDVQATFIKSKSEIMVYPGGQPIGVKLNTKGVLVVALSDIEGRMVKHQVLQQMQEYK